MLHALLYKRVHFKPELHKIAFEFKKQTHSGTYRVPLILQSVTATITRSGENYKRVIGFSPDF